MGSKLVYWLTDSLLTTGETLPESLSAQTRSTAADFLCLVTVSVYSGVPREGSGSSSSSASHPTESSDSSELLSSPWSGAEAITRSQWEELASLSPFVCSASRGVMVRKSTPNLTIISTRRAGLSFLPAYLIAVIRASISSVTVSPRPRIISFDMKAATSPARESMSIACPEH